MERFTIAERYISEDKTPIEVGDKVKILPLEKFKAENVMFHDNELLKRVSDNFFKVKKVEHWGGIFFYYCTDVYENEIPIPFVDSDIEYVLR